MKTKHGATHMQDVVTIVHKGCWARRGKGSSTGINVEMGEASGSADTVARITSR